MSERYICIHGHFYQPPRENPWLEAIELQDSAYPYHDWNERITAECYAPNMASRILDGEERITNIVNNYSKINFNFGPTLLSWMETNAHDVYKAILDGDKESQRNFSGHGSAIAQCYNHMIMPLANSADKLTQVIWGLRDFQFRFGRDPEGMWLPETAVTNECLDLLAQHGIKYTILSPHQASRIRKFGGKSWKDVADASIDPSMPYLCTLPSGRTINIFFYDGPVSRAVAFEQLLSKGENLADRLVNSFSKDRNWTQLAHIATDGETYGHHHRYGEMALSYALRYIETNHLAKITNYGEFLAKFPPTHEVEILENTSWSCSHGIERWRSDCGCRTLQADGWTQTWRTPLRQALDWLRDSTGPLFESHGKDVFKDPWAARNAYIDVALNRDQSNVERFLNDQAFTPLSPENRSRALKLMELQRNAMLMYTSCGWFFNDLSGIETVQILQYAARALTLAEEVFKIPFEEEFLKRLDPARSNLTIFGSGRQIYDRLVRPAMVTLDKVAANFALTSLFEKYESRVPIFCYTIDQEDYTMLAQGKARLAVGHVNVESAITGENKKVVFAAIHLGDHNLTSGIHDFTDDLSYRTMLLELANIFEQSDLPTFFRTIDKLFGTNTFTLKVLFKDEQRKILNLVLNETLAEAEASYRQIYEHHAPLMRFLSDLNMPLPKPFYTAAEFAINTSLRRALEADDPNLEQIEALFDEARRAHIVLDDAGISFALEKTIERYAKKFRREPGSIETLEQLELLVSLALTPPLKINFWKTQNTFYEMSRTISPDFFVQASKDDAYAAEWRTHFNSLGEMLKVKI